MTTWSDDDLLVLLNDEVLRFGEDHYFLLDVLCEALPLPRAMVTAAFQRMHANRLVKLSLAGPFLSYQDSVGLTPAGLDRAFELGVVDPSGMR